MLGATGIANVKALTQFTAPWPWLRLITLAQLGA